MGGFETHPWSLRLRPRPVSRARGDGWAEPTHVHGAIRCDHRVHRPRHPDQYRKPQGRPPAVVLELGEDDLSRGSGSHDPQRDDDSKEADEMQDQHEDLDLRELFRKEDVQTDGYRRDGDDEESSMPALERIAGVVK